MEYMTDIESMNIRYENGGESFKDGESVRYESASPSTKLSSRSYLLGSELFESRLDVQTMMMGGAGPVSYLELFRSARTS